MSVKTADPLPECGLCDMPTARAAWERNGKLCTPCAAGVAATVRMLRPGVPLSSDRRQALLQPPPTVFVEAFTPDVPGQLDVAAVFGDVYADPEVMTTQHNVRAAACEALEARTVFPSFREHCAVCEPEGER